MSELRDELRAAYEDAGYDVGEVTENRDTVRVVLLEEAGAEDVRSIAADVLGEEPSFGVNVTTESVDGHDGTSTVVSFRNR
ncbi:hypothetical protein [Halovivax sp.]|uniref:hypothetical protein n=1 Tax=Halovivax sp. TaxID=1935978 RepID=UPI0025C1157F|nr:hypothetical protein [Halovivax sp.]